MVGGKASVLPSEVIDAMLLFRDCCFTNIVISIVTWSYNFIRIPY